MDSMENTYYQNMRSNIERFARINENEWNCLKSLFTPTSFKKGEKIMVPGDRADIIYYIGKGLIKRYFICHDGREFITSLDSENRIVSNFVSLIEDEPSTIYIEAIEDTEALVSCHGVSEKLFANSTIWQEIGRKITEYRYVEKSKREYELLHYDIIGRLKIFQESNPSLYNRLTQKDVASYLGVTAVSLSRAIKKANTKS